MPPTTDLLDAPADLAPEDPAALSTLSLDGLPGSFCLHYQPEIDLATGALVGCEALLRWWHPDHGMLRPGASLHETRWADHLATLEDWSLREVCRQSAAWAAEGRALSIAVNVRPERFATPGFVDRVADAIDHAGADPSLVAIDVPLQAFSRRPGAGLVQAVDLSILGVGVVVDGVSGDACLRDLEPVPATAFKIPLYVAYRPTRGVHPAVGAAVALAHRLGAVAVAKRVESEPTVDTLRAIGFDRAFGHLFGPALTAEAIGSLAALVGSPATSAA